MPVKMAPISIKRGPDTMVAPGPLQTPILFTEQVQAPEKNSPGVHIPAKGSMNTKAYSLKP